MKTEHILVIRFSAMGDVAMTVPVIYSLAKQYPHVRITVLSRSFARPFFENLAPNVGFMEADLKGEYKGVKGLNALYRRLIAKQFTAIADLHSVLRSSYLRMRFNLSNFKVAHIDKHRKGKRKLNQDLVYTDLSNKAMVEKAVEELKKSGVECILCQDDYICDEVVRKLARMGVRIPDQMKVASCHYSRILENYPVTITSLKFNITELGRRSCQVLLDMIHGKTVPDKTLLDYEIILKESTKG